jgi:hypothetical protein
MNLRFAVFLLACAGTGAAQDKITAPLSSPGQPATVTARLVSGSIVVTPGNAGEVVVESVARDAQSVSTRGRQRERDTPPPGMHRLDVGNGGLNIEEDHNKVAISGIRPDRNGNLIIHVPVNTSVELRTVNGGSIDVSGINGDIDVENTNGAIQLTNVSGSIVAHTLNGLISATLDRVAQGKPMSFTSLNGKIDVTLPADTKARLRLKTDNGAIYTDFDVKMEAGPAPVIEPLPPAPPAAPVPPNPPDRGRYRIRVDRGVYGSINGGGPEYVFQTLNGSIYIHKK